jgi:hypothetical protein
VKIDDKIKSAVFEAIRRAPPEKRNASGATGPLKDIFAP